MTIFKTLKLGTEKPSLEGIYVSSWAQDLLDKTVYQEEKEDMNLVIMTPRELGCVEKYPTIEQIFSAAKEQGLDLCPAETSPRLREAYEETDTLFIAMKQITDRVGDPYVFHLGEGGGRLRLHAIRAKPDSGWSSDFRFVFRLRKDSSDFEASLKCGASDSLSLEERVAALEAWRDRVQMP